MSNFRIENLDINSNEQLKSLLKWKQDPAIAHFITPIRSKDTLIEIPTLDTLRKNLQQNAKINSFNYMIFDRDKIIGTFSIHIDPEHLLKKVKGTSWLGLTIGEKDYWGTGAAKVAMDYFESESIKLGATRVELGVFEFNLRAQAFYKKLDYVEFARINKFTYWQDRFWDNIRMEKLLSSS